MGCEKTQEKKTRINDAGLDGAKNQQQSARQKKHDIVIQSGGNLQVSGNKILVI